MRPSHRPEPGGRAERPKLVEAGFRVIGRSTKADPPQREVPLPGDMDRDSRWSMSMVVLLKSCHLRRESC